MTLVPVVLVAYLWGELRWFDGPRPAKLALKGKCGRAALRCAQLFGIGAEASVVFLPPSSLATRVGEGEYRRDDRARLVHSLETRG